MTIDRVLGAGVATSKLWGLPEVVSFGAAKSGAKRAALPPIRGLLPSTLIDWPGKIAAIVFLPGCNLRCRYCHAEHLLEPKTDEEIPFDEVRSHLALQKDWIDGVVICGGEPTIHAGLADLARTLRELGLAVKLDTNGTRPEVLAQLIADGLIDAASMDIKTTLDGRMVELARSPVDLEAIERSITLLLESAIEVEFRTTCCPAYVDREVVEWIARRVGPQSKTAVGAAPRLNGVEGRREPPVPGAGAPWPVAARRLAEGADYVLQRYEPQHALDPALREVRPYSAAEMEELLAAARQFNPRARLRGA